MLLTGHMLSFKGHSEVLLMKQKLIVLKEVFVSVCAHLYTEEAQYVQLTFLNEVCVLMCVCAE